MKIRSIAAVVAAVTLVGGCAKVESADKQGKEVTVTVCGEPLTVKGIPQRAVAYDTGIIETMFSLGLEDKMAGYIADTGTKRDVESSPWKASFEKVRHLSDSFTKEAIESASPDFVFAGWSYGFNETKGLTPQWVREIGAAPYILQETCRANKDSRARGTMRPFDALYADLANLGKIFGVEQRANELVAKYRAQVDAVTVPPETKRARIFLFDSGSSEPFTAGNNAAAGEIITKAGGKNVFEDLNDSWTTAAWEVAAQRNPEVIIINDYGAGPNNTVEAKIEQLKAHPLMSQTDAVRNGNFIALPYAALVEGPRNPQSVETLAKYLRSKGF